MRRRYDLTYLKDLRVERMPIEGLRLYQRNARTHSRAQIREIMKSIEVFGFCNPVLIGADGVVLAGHGRIEAAKQLRMEEVPAIRLADMSPAQRRAYALADNKLAEKAGWDTALVAVELQYITELDIDLDLTVTGFETGEIDLLLGTAANTAADDEIVEEPRPGQSVTRIGDIWELGAHRLLCADATQRESFERLLGDVPAQLVFTDPPYNVEIDGNVSGLGQINHRAFAMASGEMSESEFIAFLTKVLGHLSAHSGDGSIHFVCMDWRHCFELLSATRRVGLEFKNLCVWAKSNGGMGSLYRSRHELIFVFKNGTAPHINNIELGQHGRNRSNVWDYPGLNSFAEGRLAELKMHPTVKPLALVADAILDCSKRRGVVLDCFGGSGTTLLACERTGRVARIMEIDPLYVDVTIRRFRKATGKEVIHTQSGHTFSDLEETAGRAVSISAEAK